MIPRSPLLGMGLPAYPYTREWDEGISWRSVLVTPPEDLPLTVSYVSDKVLRVVNENYDDEHVESLIAAATEMAEHDTGRALMPQTWQLILDGFPTYEIELPRPPLIEVDSVTYTDADGDSQTLVVSPAEFQVIPSGAYAKAKLRALSGESWPSTLGAPDSVTIQYQAGYVGGEVPELILMGIKLVVVELYKNRGLSVQAISATSPGHLGLDRFWKKVY